MIPVDCTSFNSEHHPLSLGIFEMGDVVKNFIFAVTAIGLVLSTGSVLAADLPYRKAPVYVPPPVMPWTGFYFGANAGGTFGGDNSVNTSAFPSYHVVDSTYFLNNAGNPNGAYWASNSALGAAGNTEVGNRDSFIGGAQIGYNYQLSPSYVAGFETDIQGIASQNSSGSTTSSLGLPQFWVYSPGVFDTLKTTISSSKDINYFGTVRGRFGYLVTPSLLAYGTGGLAYAQVHSSTSITQTNNDQANTVATYGPGQFYENPTALSTGSFSDTRLGWTVGGGLEWMISPNWSVKAEYLYYDLGSVTYALSPLVTTSNIPGEGPTSVVNPQSTVRFNGQIARVGVNFHLN